MVVRDTIKTVDSSDEDEHTLYVHTSAKVKDPCTTIIKKKPNESELKVLIIPHKGDQKLIVFSLPKNVNCVVNDILIQLEIEFKEKFDNIYSVKDPKHGVRYVIISSQNSNAGIINNKELLSEDCIDTVDLINDRASEASSLNKNETDVNSQIISHTQRLTSSLRRDTQILLQYPFRFEKGCITITTEDFKCLNNNQYINDVIIEFYLKYLSRERLSLKNQRRIYVFNTYFYTRLSNPRRKSITDKLTPALQHNEVKRWTKNINIFEKDFAFVPILQSAHWFLAIITYPGLLSAEKKASLKDFDQSNGPCILIFDSIGAYTVEANQVVQNLKNYLYFEYSAKMGKPCQFSKTDIKVVNVDVPYQLNTSTCGLYLLQYVESFFKDFVENNSLKINSKLSLCNWFEDEIILTKRQELKQLLIKLSLDFRRMIKRKAL